MALRNRIDRQPGSDAGEMELGEDFLGSVHIETPFEQRTLALYRIAGNAHGLIVDTIIWDVNERDDLSGLPRALTLSGRGPCGARFPCDSPDSSFDHARRRRR